LQVPRVSVPSGGPQAFELVPRGITLGAEIRGLDLRRPLTPVQREELAWALDQWKLLIFPGQPLSIAEQAAFAGGWGTLTDDQLGASTELAPEECVVVFGRDADTVGSENAWHSDGTFRPVPTAGTTLRAVEVPGRGGDTLFADMAAAFDNLSEDTRARIAGLTAEHDWSIGYYAQKYASDLPRLRAQTPPVTHPVVIAHPRTGRPTLFVNPLFTARIEGLEPSESDRLLSELFTPATLPELQFRLHWEPDTLILWDNLAVQHYGASDYYPQRRVLARATFFPAEMTPPQPAFEGSTAAAIRSRHANAASRLGEHHAGLAH
jgi:taurine dioxygenase